MSQEKELIEQVKKGNQGAFEVLVKIHYSMAIRIAARYLRASQNVDDVVQDSFVKAYQAIHKFQGRSQFKTWLGAIVRNTSINYLRKNKRFQQILPSHEALMVSLDDGYLMKDQKMRSRVVAQLVSMLAPKQKRALELRIYEGMSFKEIAKEMNCPCDTAKANFRHAIIRLRSLVFDKNKLNYRMMLREDLMVIES